MPKRSSKAASRRARQRPVKRPLGHVVVPPPQATPIPPVGTPDALEAESLDPPQRSVPPLAAGAGSSLSLRERAEYHYVERDLRNIAVLTLLMLVALAGAWFAFNQLGLTT